MIIDGGEGLNTGVVRNTRPDRDGRFTISGVTPGTYTLVARSMVDVPSTAGASPAPDWGSTDIIVDGQDELNAGVSLQPSLVISGRLASEGSRARPALMRGFKVPGSRKPADERRVAAASPGGAGR